MNTYTIFPFRSVNYCRIVPSNSMITYPKRLMSNCGGRKSIEGPARKLDYLRHGITVLTVCTSSTIY